jgi:hypothetical protein
MLVKIINHGQLCRRFCLVHESGDRLYPYAKRSRQSGRIHFAVAKPGSQNNLASAEIAVLDESELERLVVQQHYSVRCRTERGTRDGLYNVDGHSILRVEHA